jgi:hypothetical protein
LLQLLGTDLKYRFAWTVVGPYCENLVEITENLKRNDDISREASLLPAFTAARIRERISRLRDYISILNVMCTVHYYKWIASGEPDKINEFNINNLISEHKGPSFNQDLISLAWKKLDELGLITQKSLKKENIW